MFCKTRRTLEILPDSQLVSVSKYINNIIYRVTEAEVWFVDFGNRDKVKITDLWYLNPEHVELPGQAIPLQVRLQCFVVKKNLKRGCLTFRLPVFLIISHPREWSIK